MGKSKAHGAKILNSCKDSNIGDMFSKMMGASDADASIIRPKIVKINNRINYICKILLQLSEFTQIRRDFPEMIASLDEITTFVEQLRLSLSLSNEEYREEQYMSLSDAELNTLYRTMKENNYFKTIIVMCGKLATYKYNYTDINTAKENFVNQEVGVDLYIFSFSRFDLKRLWNSPNITSSVKRYIIKVMSKLYEESVEIHNIITAPDIDIDVFVEVLRQNITTLRKHPELSRCQNAFNKIENSIGLLKNNFGSYYRETVTSKDPNSMIISFIMDVSNTSKANRRTMFEFKTIIRVLRESSSKTASYNDPNLKKIFNLLETSMVELSSKTKQDEEQDEEQNEEQDETTANNDADNINRHASDSDEDTEVTEQSSDTNNTIVQ